MSTVMLVDDHVLVRAGIRSLIVQLDDFSVIAEASNQAQAMAELAKCTPDIVITDISMGSDSGLELVKAIKDVFPLVQTIILSMHASEEMVTEALRNGASGYLLKESAPAELEIALRAVARQESYLSPAVSTKMIDRFVRAPTLEQRQFQSLTSRQLQILTMIVSSKGTKEIAFLLDLSEKTVAAHRVQLMERLGVRDLVSLVLLAIKHGLVADDKLP